MGVATSVTCPACGYRAKELDGVGGGVGMLMIWVFTVSCPKKRRLLDVWETDEACEKRALAPDYEPFEPPEQVVPCPSCGEVHPPWDPKSAVCPRCGEPGCRVEALGICWD